MKNNILIIDTNLENCNRIENSLYNTDTEVYCTHSLVKAIDLVRTRPYTLVVMDILISHTSVWDFIEVLNDINPTPILALSAQVSTVSPVLTFHRDEDASKPDNFEGCLAQAQSLIWEYTKSHCASQQNYVLVGQNPFIIDTARRVVAIPKSEAALTSREYELLWYLLINSNQVLSYEQIYQAIWREEYLDNNSQIYNLIQKLRKKIGIDGLFEAIYGIGYRLRDCAIR